MSSPFSARYITKCLYGHSIVTGDYIAYNLKGDILCRNCADFATRNNGSHGIIYSNKFCKKCYLELPLDGSDCGNCD